MTWRSETLVCCCFVYVAYLVYDLFCFVVCLFYDSNFLTNSDCNLFWGAVVVGSSSLLRRQDYFVMKSSWRP